VIEIVPPEETTYVPAPVPTVVPLTTTAVMVPPVMVTLTGKPLALLTATVLAGTAGVVTRLPALGQASALMSAVTTNRLRAIGQMPPIPRGKDPQRGSVMSTPS